MRAGERSPIPVRAFPPLLQAGAIKKDFKTSLGCGGHLVFPGQQGKQMFRYDAYSRFSKNHGRERFNSTMVFRSTVQGLGRWNHQLS